MKAATPKCKLSQRAYLFQSTPPVKAATILCGITPQAQPISIHAAREGGDRQICVIAGYLGISIHAAREGGDAEAVAQRGKEDISIHAAREGGDRIAR